MLCNYSKSKIDGSESLEVLAGCKNLIQTTISVEKSDVLPEETMWVELHYTGDRVLYLELPQAVVAQIVEASRYPT
tara:strand:+ start:1203 stop:1430 length:228 start_codon:yes stop_codon:yes gene_type:complete